MRHRGKYIVLGILLLAILLAGGNMMFQARSSQRAVEYWGREAAQRMRAAPHVEVLQLSESESAAEFVQAGSRRLSVVREVDASRAPGLLHVRRALTSDGLYDWEAKAPAGEIVWRYALRFREDENESTLLLDGACLIVAAAKQPDNPLHIRPNPRNESPLKAFVEEQFNN
jgi:hypothetical protein